MSGEHLGGSRASVEHAPTVVAHHDGAGPGLNGLFSGAGRHDALDDEGHFEALRNVTQLLCRLRSCGQLETLQERQPCGIDVHGNGERPAGSREFEAALQRFSAPRLHGGHADSVCLLDGLAGPLKQLYCHPVAGKSGNPFGLGRSEGHAVVGQRVERGAVMAVHVAHRCNEQRH